MKSYLIRVRIKQGVYDSYTYKANCRDDAKKFMYERIWKEYGCFNPEIIHVTEL